MEDFKERAKELVSKMTLAEKIAQMQHDAPAIERLGIPAYNWWNEALHGVARSGTATVFPQAIAMAASFNEDLMYKVAEDISNEVRAKYNGYKSFGSTKIYQGRSFHFKHQHYRLIIYNQPESEYQTYEKPIISVDKGLAEGVYAASGATSLNHNHRL